MRALLPLLAALALGCEGPQQMVKAMSQATDDRPDPGDTAPDFKAAATNGGSLGLSDYKGKQTLVLAFFPKAFTGG